ncbi:MAG: DUF262 domain-containing protein [Lachnospiraceae bacterium]|mgnify:FL=1|jgi:Protein of unknown function DUF262.|nr:DUF262 domain-containing protein [Lachnospiraceae bacterium]
MDTIMLEGSILEHQEELEIDYSQNGKQIYPMDGIKVDKGFYSVFELRRRYQSPNKRIVLDSDFQRDNVWSLKRKAELVESVLMGLPLPVFYFNQDKYGRLIVVDGRQRLSALFEYMDDEYALQNLNVMPQLNEKRFSELSPVMAGRLEDYQIQAHVILPPTPDRVKFDIFDRVNRGGVQLNKQEIRNALYQGKATELLKRLASCGEFFSATGGAFKDEKRMKDKYILTRFLTFYLFKAGLIQNDQKERYEYKGDMDDFLGKGMDALNNMEDGMLQKLEDRTKLILDRCWYYLGENAFRIHREGRKSPINMNVFEAVMFVMNFVPDLQENLKSMIQRRVFAFIDSDVFQDNIAGRRDSEMKLMWRMEQSEALGREIKKYVGRHTGQEL